MSTQDQLDVLLKEFELSQWHERESLVNDTNGHVYILLASKGASRIPFYVGMTRRLKGRMEDYEYAAFWAPTDFKVGTAIKHIVGMAYDICIAWKKHERCAEEEIAVIRKLLTAGYPLLNSFPGYTYRKDDAFKDSERKSVEGYCGTIFR